MSDSDRIIILKKYIEKNHKSVRQFCIQYNITPSTISEAFTGKRPFGIEMADNIENKIGIKIFTESAQFKSVNAFTPIKLYAVKACAGDGKEMLEEDELNPIAIPTKDITKLMLNPQNLKAVEVSGHCMEPKYQNESYVVIDITKKEVGSRNPYIVRFDNEILLKRLDKTGGVITLKSDNPDKTLYGDKEVKPGIDFEIIGEVVYKMGGAN